MIGRSILVATCCAVIVFCSVTTLRAIKGRDVCGTVERNAVELRHIVIDGAVKTKAFGTITLGGKTSTYSERLADAYVTADRIRGCP